MLAPVALSAVLAAGMARGGASFDRRVREAEGRGEFPDLTSLVLVKAGRTVYEGYFNGSDASALNDTRSAMKSVTALAVGIAVAEGKIPSLGAPVFALLADLRPFANDGPLKEAITVEDFLTMSSALDCNDMDEKSPGNEENMYPLRTWSRWAVDLPVKAGYARDASGRGPFSYCTAGVFLLGQAIGRASGVPVDRYIERVLLDPLGIARREWPRSPSGEVMTGGGLRLRSRDLAKLAQMIVEGGKWQGRQVVPAAFVDAALTVRHHEATAAQDYGYLFWRRDYVTRCGTFPGWFMGGNGGNAIVMLREQRALAVVTRTHYGKKGMHGQTTHLLEQYALPELLCDSAPR